ncbi:MAG TPA: SDR family oxidoreductase [Chloroflexota bacterium]|nr:SDR family oxidoreductase [Chloroflexota bacterium]
MLADFSLQGKVAVVTGGARGLGLEMMEALAEAGAAVVAVDRLGGQAAEAAAQTAARYGTRAGARALDVTDPLAVVACFADITREFGAIDILVAAAGIVDNIAAEDYPPDAWRKIIDVNINGVFFCAQAAGRAMIAAASGGSMILIASMSGMIVNRPQKQAPYNVSKAGVIMMAKSLAAEWAPHGIRVNALAPGYMRTAMTDQVLAEQPALRATWEELTPQGRMGMPAELRGSVVYLASAASSYVTGHTLVVDGGYTAW